MGKHRTFSLETRRKMSEAHKGKKLSPEHRRKISEATRGKKHRKFSLEARQRMSEAHKGKKLSPEHKKRISEGKQGKPHPMQGKHHTLEARQKMSEARRGEKNHNWGKRGKDAPGWKGGRRYSNGYVRIFIPDHPRADCGGYMAEHRLVVEKALGRYLKRDELVHHINSIRDDNRLENLELVDRHRRQICPRCGWPMGDLLIGGKGG